MIVRSFVKLACGVLRTRQPITRTAAGSSLPVATCTAVGTAPHHAHVAVLLIRQPMPVATLAAPRGAARLFGGAPFLVAIQLPHDRDANRGDAHHDARPHAYGGRLEDERGRVERDRACSSRGEQHSPRLHPNVHFVGVRQGAARVDFVRQLIGEDQGSGRRLGLVVDGRDVAHGEVTDAGGEEVAACGGEREERLVAERSVGDEGIEPAALDHPSLGALALVDGTRAGVEDQRVASSGAHVKELREVAVEHRVGQRTIVG
mmetsp:Transcript_42388/g.105550  ORF Transcript_42388/g.105550 Transcript_42388/m.105550 type:complete len:261 (-) Transcript_42388:1312-2094(-)